MTSSGPAPSRSRLVLFALLGNGMVLLVAELVLWLGGVVPASVNEDPYVGFDSRLPLFVEQSSGELATAPNRLRFFNRQQFSRTKESNGHRVFCIGGSTTYGRPYDHRVSFCGWLAEMLATAQPTESWEVINAGGISYASYRVSLVLEELVDYEPDLVVIYTGHNEFLEARTYAPVLALPRWARVTGGLAARSRSVTVAKRGWRFLGERLGLSPSPRSSLPAEVRTRLDATAGPEAFHRDDAFAEAALRHFRLNLKRMTDLAMRAGARPLLVVPAANLRHMSPFKSEPSVIGESLGRLQERFDTGVAALANENFTEAIAALSAAIDIDARYADAWYRLGQALDGAGRFTEARAAYQKARDEDICTLRAPSRFEEAVREVATERDLPLVDFAAWAARSSPDEIPGRELFLDHVHPTIDGHRQLARLLYDTLQDDGILPPAAILDSASEAAIADRVLGRLTPDDRGGALLNLSKVLGWAGKLEEANELALAAAAASPNDPDALYQAGLTAQLSGDLEAAVGHYLETLARRPGEAVVHGNLAAALEALDRLEAATVHYRRAFELDRERPERRRNLVAALRTIAQRRQQGDQNGATAALLEIQLLTTPPTNTDAAISDPIRLATLGESRLRAGDAHGAIPLLSRSLALAPDRDAVRHLLATTLARVGQPQDGEALLREAIANDLGEAATHRVVLGSMLFRRGEHRKAVEQFAGALGEQPNLVQAATNLAWLQATSSDSEIRNPDSALRWARHAATLVSGDASVLDTLAAAEAASGHFERALAAATEAHQLALARDSRLAAAIADRIDLYRHGKALTATH